MPYEVDPYMSDAQVWNRGAKSVPYWNDFSTDAFFGLDPKFRGPVSDAIYEAEGDPIGAYAVAGDREYQDALAKSIKYDDLLRQGVVDFIPHDQLKDRSVEKRAYIQDVLDNFFAQAAPTSERNIGLIDQLSQRYDGVPYSGGELPTPGGPGFTGGGGGSGGKQFSTAPEDYQRGLTGLLARANASRGLGR